MSAVKVTCALIEEQGKVLVAQRAVGKALAGKWEFPGGKIDSGESPERCLEREIREELGCEIQIGAPLTPVLHEYPGGRIELIPFRCSVSSGAPAALEHAAIAWEEPDALHDRDLAEADVPVLEEYLEFLNQV